MVTSVASDNRAQLQTFEGFAAAMLMVGTLYLAITAVTLNVPQTELHMDAQLKTYVRDSLYILDVALPPETDEGYYCSVLKNLVTDWVNVVAGMTSFETEELRVKHTNGSYMPYTSYKFEFAGPPLNTNKSFYTYIPNNTRISHAYVTLTGMPLLNIVGATTTPQTKYKPWNPSNSSDQFGCAIAYGDVNNDNVSDLIIGACGNSSDSGIVYIYYGNNSSIGTWEGAGPNITITNPGLPGDHFGWAVVCGDVNGDGVDDVIVGAPENGTPDTGAVYLYNGPIPTDAPAPNVTIQNPRIKGAPANGRFGGSLACGDVNGDSFGDILIGAPTARECVSNCGIAFVYFGGDPFSGTKTKLYNPYNESDYFGISVASVDINGDGLSDIVIGANASNPASYIRYGGTSLPPVINGAYNNEMNLTLRGKSGSGFGISVSSAGDVDGDGVCDLIIGAPNNDSAYVFYGGSTPDCRADINLTGESGSGFGISVSSAGDVDSDGSTGVIVGRSDDKAEVLYDVDFIVDPIRLSETDSGFGSVVSHIGDVDADGIPDIAVGAPGDGKVYVYTPKFPELPWLAVGNTTDLADGNRTKVWEYTTVIKTDDGNRAVPKPVPAGNSTDKILPIYREIPTDAILSMYVKTDSGDSADVRISVNGVEVNASSPSIDTGGNWTWHNITLPGDITEWRIGDNTITINVTSDTPKIGVDGGGADMIRVILPITQPFRTTERTSDFADAINDWTVSHPLNATANETWWAVPFTLHSNSSGAINITNLHLKATPSLGECLDALLPDFVAYNVVFAYLDTLTKGWLYTFSDDHYQKTLNFTGNKTLMVHILLPENTTAVYGANMDVTGLPNESIGIDPLTLNFAEDADAVIVVDSEGDVHIGYSKNNPQLWYIHSEGGTWVEGDISKGGGDTNNISMTVDSSDELHAAFIKGNPANNHRVSYSRTYDGVWISSTIEVNDSTNPPPSQPCIAVDAANVPHIVWVENASIYYSNNTAGAWSPAMRVNDTTNATTPLLNIDSNNTKHLVFLVNRTVYYMNTSGGSFGVPVRVDSSTNVSKVSMSSGCNDYLHLAWAENGTTLYYSNNTAGFWSQKEPVYNGSDPSIATDCSNTSHIVWTDAGNVYYSNNADGSWSPQRSLGSGYIPTIAVDADGKVHVVWGDGNTMYYYGPVLNYPTKPYIVIHNSTVWNYNIEEINHNNTKSGSRPLGDNSTDVICKEFDMDEAIEGQSYLSIYTKGNNGSINIYVNDNMVRSAFIPKNISFVWHNITLPPGVWQTGINELRINGSPIDNDYGYANSTDGVNDMYYDNGTLTILDYTWMIRVYATEYRGTRTTRDFSDPLNAYISSHNASGGNYNITFTVHSDTEGKIHLSDLRIFYYIRGNGTQVRQQRIITNGIPQDNSVTTVKLVTIQDTDITASDKAVRIPDASMAPDINLWNIVEVRLEAWYK